MLQCVAVCVAERVAECVVVRYMSVYLELAGQFVSVIQAGSMLKVVLQCIWQCVAVHVAV